jgi:hypothetical protein
MPAPDGVESSSDRKQNVGIIIEFEQVDWIYVVHPGALRRIIMNIFGNAMKYTDNGSITIRLETADDEKAEAQQHLLRRKVHLVVSDTGKGMSEEFMRSRLYRPFSQEDTSTLGTGLGLSIVRSMVRSLGGDLNIRTKLGEGTSVTVALFLDRPGIDTISITQSNADCLWTKYPSRNIAIFGYTLGSADSGRWRSVARYITDWFGLKLVSWPFNGEVDVLLGDSDQMNTNPPEGAMRPLSFLLFLNPGANGLGGHIQLSSSFLVSYIRWPCGPHKLAARLLECLDGVIPMASADVLEPPPSAPSTGNLQPGNVSLYDSGRRSAIAADPLTCAKAPYSDLILQLRRRSVPPSASYDDRTVLPATIKNILVVEDNLINL